MFSFVIRTRESRAQITRRLGDWVAKQSCPFVGTVDDRSFDLELTAECASLRSIARRSDANMRERALLEELDTPVQNIDRITGVFTLLTTGTLDPGRFVDGRNVNPVLARPRLRGVVLERRNGSVLAVRLYPLTADILDLVGKVTFSCVFLSLFAYLFGFRLYDPEILILGTICFGFVLNRALVLFVQLRRTGAIAHECLCAVCGELPPDPPPRGFIDRMTDLGSLFSANEVTSIFSLLAISVALVALAISDSPKPGTGAPSFSMLLDEFRYLFGVSVRPPTHHLLPRMLFGGMGVAVFVGVVLFVRRRIRVRFPGRS
jgi:hypothetical protein